MDNLFIVYCHKCPNNKCYFGITKQKPTSRWRNGKGYKNNVLFYRAIQKYGWENIDHKIVAEHLSKQDACELEKSLIEQHKSNQEEYGYNISIGGECGTFGAKLSESTRKKMSESRKGENNNFYGKHHTKESIKKNRIAHLGKNGFWKEKKLSEEHKRKIKENHAHLSGGECKQSKPVICIETGKRYEAISVASRETKICDDSISKVCRGIIKTAGGYHWKYGVKKYERTVEKHS